MQALLGVIAALLGSVLVPLALAGGTAWLVVPGHLMLAAACTGGAVLAGLGGRPGRARAFGGGYLLASLAMVAALGLGSDVRGGSWYWMVPWSLVLCWGWVPPVVAGAMAFVGTSRRRSRTRSVVRRRRRRLERAREWREAEPDPGA